MSILGRDTLLATLPKLVAGELVAQKQDESQVVFSPTIKPEEEKLSLTLNAKQIDWKVRALRPAPGAYFENFNGKRTKLWDVTPLAETTSLPAGAVVAVTKHELKLAAADGSVYQVNELQPAGKPRMQVTAYLNGVGQGLREGQVIISAE